MSTKFNINSIRRTVALLSLSISALSAPALADVSGYLPLKQDPGFENHVNRLMIAAELGGTKKPYAINTVKMAKNKVCTSRLRGKPAITKACNEVNKYLKRTQQSFYVNHASAGLRLVDESKTLENQPALNIANARGESIQSSAFAQAQLATTLNSYMAVSVGAKIWQQEDYFDSPAFNAQYPGYDIDNHNLEDTYVSLGFYGAQLDIGYKPHWLSPFKQSAMLLSTNAPTFANISLSNNTPLTDWQFNYELFAGELSYSNKIRYEGGLTQGKPIITGVHLSVSPFSGFTLAVNRILQSGGGDRGGRSFSELVDAFLDPSGADNTREGLNSDQEFGNQAASIVTRYDFNGYKPFSVYMEYAGEDTSRGTNYRLGNTSLSAGIDMPVIFYNLSLNYEYSQWQRGWYTHHVYQDGIVNQGSLVGHWAAEQRERFNSIGGSSTGATHHNLTLGWQLNPHDRLEFNYNTTKKEPLSAYPYKTGRQLKLDWFTDIYEYRALVSLLSSKNTLGEKHTALSLALYW